MTRVIAVGIGIAMGLDLPARGAAVRVIAEERRTQSPVTIRLDFDLPDLPVGKQVRLGLDARIDWPSPAGSNPWMAVSVNGRGLRAPDLINKPFEPSTPQQRCSSTFTRRSALSPTHRPCTRTANCSITKESTSRPRTRIPCTST